MRLIAFILVTGLVQSCATVPRQASHSYSLGMGRKEVREGLADSWLLISASRPVTGWSGDVSPPAGGQAAAFESSNAGIIVETCDVYRVGHTNALKMYYGIWLDYFYFDRNDRLVGSGRWVID